MVKYNCIVASVHPIVCVSVWVSTTIKVQSGKEGKNNKNGVYKEIGRKTNRPRKELNKKKNR